MFFRTLVIIVGMGFISYGIAVKNRKTASKFYRRNPIQLNHIKNVIEYNQTLGKMWQLYGASFFIVAIVDFFSTSLANDILLLLCIIGMIALPLCYQKIYKKYR